MRLLALARERRVVIGEEELARRTGGAVERRRGADTSSAGLITLRARLINFVVSIISALEEIAVLIIFNLA